MSKLILLAVLACAGAAAYFARSSRHRDTFRSAANEAGGKLRDMEQRVEDAVRP
jgi:hypothetical protein